MRLVRRMPNSMKVQVAWLVAVFLVVWASAPVVVGGGSSEGLPTSALAQSAGASESEEEQVAGADVKVDLSPGATTVASGVRLSVLEVQQEPLSAIAGEAGDCLVSVRLALENRGASSIAYTALDLGVEGADGSVHARLGTRRGPGSVITYGVLEPGATIVGWRVFVVPAVVDAVRLSGRLGRSG